MGLTLPGRFRDRSQPARCRTDQVFGFIKQSDAATGAPPEALVPLGNGETVLVVEDDAAVRRVVMRQLYKLGYLVEAARNADEALQILERHRPIDILFTDIVMPGRADGFALSRIVAERWPRIGIILTSGFPDVHAGAPDMVHLPLLSKPYDKADLAQRVYQTLRGRRYGF